MGLTQVWKDAVESRVNLAQAFACPGLQDHSRQRRLELESSLYHDLRRLFAIEHKIEEDFLKNVRDHKTLSQEQAKAAALVHASRRYLPPECRYRACIPWRSQQRPPNNLWAALRIFKEYVRRQGHGSDAIIKMNTTVEEWLSEGYARVLSSAEARRPGGYVIPSFIVTRVDKTSTQHRLVINAAKEFRGHCLNDFIARTPGRDE